MEGTKISEIIKNCCIHNGISYFSKYQHNIYKYKADALEMAEIYRQLKEINAKLYIYSERYKDLPEVHKELDKVISMIDKAEHMIIYDAHKIVRAKKVKHG